MKRYDWSALDEAGRRAALARPGQRRDSRVVSTVKKIFREVEREGAPAVARWAEKLDGHAPRRLDLDTKVVSAARNAIDFEDLEALELAVENVARYHDAIRPQETMVRPTAGVRCKRVWRPIPSCGLYVPGGTAPLFSTLIMLALPALSAGVPERVSVTPPAKDGSVLPMMIAAGAACGLDAIWLVGGAHAVAALTYGAGLPRVDKIFGPGNAYVAEAKRYAAELPGGPAIDLPAGPSELMVIADKAADPEVIAADLLSQAEHDADAQVVLVSDDSAQIEDVARALEAQLADLPRAGIARKSLTEARAILDANREEAAAVANLYGPEHLSLQVEDAMALVPLINSAGTVFVGRWAAETFGDYVAGPSHVLPTDGAAITWSGVNVASFMTSFAVQEMDAEGARALAGPAARLARLEGLEAHARAADIRGG